MAQIFNLEKAYGYMEKIKILKVSKARENFTYKKIILTDFSRALDARIDLLWGK